MEKQVNRYSAITLALNTIFLRGKTEIRAKKSNLASRPRVVSCNLLNRRSGSFVLDAFEEMSNGSIA